MLPPGPISALAVYSSGSEVWRDKSCVGADQLPGMACRTRGRRSAGEINEGMVMSTRLVSPAERLKSERKSRCERRDANNEHV